MNSRCSDSKATGYRRYGGRGIKVCERWKKFENFLEDMGERPPNTSLDRFPNKNGNYEPGNCRWATKQQQRWNTADVVMYDFNGETIPLYDIARRTNANYGRLRFWVKKRGFSVEEGLRRAAICGRWAHHV